MYSHFTNIHTKKEKKQKKMNKKRPDPYRLPPPFIFVFSTAFYLSFLNLSLDAEHTMHLSCVMVIGREGSTDNPLNKPPLQWPTTTQHYCSPTQHSSTEISSLKHKNHNSNFSHRFWTTWCHGISNREEDFVLSNQLCRTRGMELINHRRSRIC